MQKSKEIISFKVEGEVKESIKKRAAATGVTTSSFISFIVNEAMEDKTITHAELVRRIVPLQNDVNDLYKMANNLDSSNKAEFIAKLDKIKEGVNKIWHA